MKTTALRPDICRVLHSGRPIRIFNQCVWKAASSSSSLPFLLFADSLGISLLVAAGPQCFATFTPVSQPCGFSQERKSVVSTNQSIPGIGSGAHRLFELDLRAKHGDAMPDYHRCARMLARARRGAVGAGPRPRSHRRSEAVRGSRADNRAVQSISLFSPSADSPKFCAQPHHRRSAIHCTATAWRRRDGSFSSSADIRQASADRRAASSANGNCSARSSSRAARTSDRFPAASHSARKAAERCEHCKLCEHRKPCEHCTAG